MPDGGGDDGGGDDSDGGGPGDLTMMDAAVGAAAVLLGCAFLAPVFYFAVASERPE